MDNAYTLLETFLTARAQTCVHTAQGQLPRRFVTPSFGVIAGVDDNGGTPVRSSVGHYPQMYDWDACFFAQVAEQLGLQDMPPDVVLNFLSLQEADGHIPRTVSPNRIWDRGDQAKPFLCQTLAGYLKAHADKVAAVLTGEVLVKLNFYLLYFENNRRHTSGLYRWRNVLESGVDDNLALIFPTEAARDENEDLGKFPDSEIIAVDASTYMACEFEAFSWLAQIAGKADLAQAYADKSQKLKELIEDKLWDENLKMYVNLHARGDTAEGTYVRLRSWTGLTPVLMGIARGDRAKLCIEQNILAPEHFLRPAGVASFGASEHLYNNMMRGLYGRNKVSNWQGPVWVLVNALTCRGLVAYGYSKEAITVANLVLTTMEADVKASDSLHENYNAETGAALWAPDFMSWNSLAIEMIALVRSVQTPVTSV